MGWDQAAQTSLKFGLIGGIGNVLQGGKFGHGFVSAGVGPLLGRGLGSSNLAWLGREGKAAARLIVGGSISKMTGGKFANGAATTAFSMITNSVGRGGDELVTTSDSSGKYNGVIAKPVLFDENGDPLSVYMSLDEALQSGETAAQNAR